MTPIVLDMETQDPDDALTLAVLATHPQAILLAVTVTPGAPDQVGLVRCILTQLGISNVPIGVRDPDRTKPAVSAFHRKWLKDFPDAKADGLGSEIMQSVLMKTSFSDVTLVTGAALSNPARFVTDNETPRFSTWVGQGGFAGDSVVPPEHRLPKFAGRETCPTFNFNGDPTAAQTMLDTTRIARKYLVSKNVCHGVVWDKTFHERMDSVPRHAGLELAFQGMTRYLGGRAGGKAAHDLLALAVAINPRVCDFRPVSVYRERGEWGSRLAEDTPEAVRISISVDRELFFQTLVGHVS